MKRSILKLLFLCLSGPMCGSCSANAAPEEVAGLSLRRVSAHTLPAAGGDLNITCASALPVSAQSDQPWLVEKSTSTQGDATTFTFAASENGETQREATLTFFSGNEHLSLTITQQRRHVKPAIPATPAGEFAMKLTPGWNLGNQLDAHTNGVADETAWGNMAATQKLFNRIKQLGFKSVRIPVTWMGRTGAAPDYQIEKAWLDRVEQVVGYARTCGLHAIINIHHDGCGSDYWLNIKRAAADAAYNDEVKARLSALWRQIAVRFQDMDEFLIFEMMNEIQDGGWGNGDNLQDGGRQYAVLNEWNQLAVKTVRATGGKNATRYLAVAGYSANPRLTIDHLVLPEDSAKDRLLISVHSYDPTEYAIDARYSEWGHTAAPDKKAPQGDEDFIRTMCANLYDKYVSKGIPVYFGECGSVHRADARAESFRKYYIEYFCKAATTYGIAAFYWDNGNSGVGKESFGLINHSSGAFLNNGKEIVDRIIRACTEQDENYTLEFVRDNAPE
ncbi:cellulase family glycosylhydrolase [Alistipes sp.]|uniref:cellulase family glycosylhydrolase n=1 Tax=Alistipes sp. TaxID=1872444 RepID=UPI0025C1FD86|nr:cellulase family glycosylhydrolase [Alistipes sp.]